MRWLSRWFKILRMLHKEWNDTGVSVSRDTTHGCLQEKSGNRRTPNIKKLLKKRHECLTCTKEKKNKTTAQWSRGLFSDESKCFAFHLEIKVPEPGGKVFETQQMKCLQSLECHFICWCCRWWSTVFYQVQNQYSSLPGDIMLTSNMEILCSFSISTCPQCQTTTKWFTHYITTVLDWSANLPDLNPKDNSPFPTGYCL